MLWAGVRTPSIQLLRDVIRALLSLDRKAVTAIQFISPGYMRINSRYKSRVYMNLITSSKAMPEHQDIIFSWLDEPHMQEFWDNSQAHRNDITLFIDGRKKSSNYFNGIFSYWIGYHNNMPFCLIMTAEESIDSESSDLKKANISKTSKTFGIDFGIGNKDLLGKGHANDTLTAFCEFFKSTAESFADRFLIDPAENNLRAKHVYKKAGFKEVGSFKRQGGSFDGHETCLMMKTF